MSKKNKKNKKDKAADDGQKDGKEANSSDTKIATLTFSASSLTAQLLEARSNYDLLSQNSAKFAAEYCKKIESQQEIILFLEKTVHDLKKKCSKYEDQHKSERKRLAAMQAEKDDIIEQMKLDQKQDVNALNMKINRVEDELKDLIEFKENKLSMEAELAYFKNMLEKEKKERESREAFLERRFLSERERLKKEMLNKIRETKLRLLSMTEDQLHTTTKRTIMENEQMTIELQYQSKETQKLIKNTNEKAKSVNNLKRQITLHKNTEAMLAKRTYFLQKLVDQLHAQIKRMRQQNTTAKSMDVTARPSMHEMAFAGADAAEQPEDVQILLEQAEAKGERKLELKMKKLRNENRTLSKRLVEAQKTVDRMSQQSTTTNDKNKHSIYKTNSEKFLAK